MKNASLFQFRLRPLAEVMPWGESQKSLHWFGLTDGWFWIQAGEKDVYSDGIPVWEATVGELVLPVSAFRAEVLSLDRSLMATMAERVKQVRHGVLDPKIFVDVDALEREQDDRSQSMRRAINHWVEYFSWDEVRTAVNTISP